MLPKHNWRRYYFLGVGIDLWQDTDLEMRLACHQCNVVVLLPQRKHMPLLMGREFEHPLSVFGSLLSDPT
jgi:hypothetical protein